MEYLANFLVCRRHKNVPVDDGSGSRDTYL